MTAQFNKHILGAAIASALVVTSQLTLADADIGVQAAGNPVQATTNVDLRVVVPEILIFGVGAVGDGIARISWAVDSAIAGGTGDNQTYGGAAGPFAASDVYAATPTATIEANGGTGSSVSTNQATLPVFLFSNSGSDVTITSSMAGGPTGGGTADVLTHASLATTIPIADFTAGESGNVIQPDFSAGGTPSADTVAGVSGIVNEAGTWTYEYVPSATPVAGAYSGRVTYVAAQP